MAVAVAHHMMSAVTHCMMEGRERTSERRSIYTEDKREKVRTSGPMGAGNYAY